MSLIRTARTDIHGRYLVAIPDHSRATLVGFHGYKENAAIHMAVMRRIAGDRPIGLISIQGLHRFYASGGTAGAPTARSLRGGVDVVASWMTREDREHAIADNVAYVGKVLTMVADEFGMTRPMIYAGFSQGVAMAFRAATLVQRPCDGVIALASDVPPDVAPLAASLPRVLYGRGEKDDLYPAIQSAKDLEVLRSAGVHVSASTFDGGHEWTPAFIEKSAAFVDELIASA
jgi:predicted esterase